MRSLVVVVVLLGLTGRADAQRKDTPLADVMQRASTIVLATYQRPAADTTDVHLVVERSLRGGFGAGRYRVKTDGNASYSDKEQLVAFIDASGTWFASGTRRRGAPLEIELLAVANDQSHDITPNLITIEQLAKYAATGALETLRYRGAIHVLPAAERKPAGRSTFQIEVDSTGAVTGLPARSKLGRAQVTVGGYFMRELEVVWTLGKTRVQLSGDVVGRHDDGAMAVNFDLVSHGLVDEPTLAKLLTDPVATGYPVHEYTITFENGRRPMKLTLSSRDGHSRIDGVKLVDKSAFSYPTPAGTVIFFIGKRTLATELGNPRVEIIALGSCEWHPKVRTAEREGCTAKLTDTRFVK